MKGAWCGRSLSKVEANDKKDLCGIQKQKQKPLWDKGLQWDKIGEESKSITKAAARDKPHGEEIRKKKKKKKNPKAGTERINKSCGRKKRKGF